MAVAAELKSGLASVSFRQMNPPQITALCRRAGLTGIEWGGDVHVPHGDLEMARRVHELTLEAGLEIAAYGSYYRVGSSEQDGLSFNRVLGTAQALGAPLIRVWAGIKSSARADKAYIHWVSDEAMRIAGLAQEAGIKVAFEYHSGTLTDTRESAASLMQDSPHPNLYSLWQPPGGWGVSACLESLESVRPHLLNVHVFHSESDAEPRQSLEAGRDRWQAYIEKLRQMGGARYCLLEFVKDDEPEQLIRDATVLHALLQ